MTSFQDDSSDLNIVVPLLFASVLFFFHLGMYQFSVDSTVLFLLSRYEIEEGERKTACLLHYEQIVVNGITLSNFTKELLSDRENVI